MDILVGSAITSKMSKHLNIIPMSVGGRGVSLARGYRYVITVYLIIRTAFSFLPRLSRHSGRTQWRCHLPTQTWKTASAVQETASLDHSGSATISFSEVSMPSSKISLKPSLPSLLSSRMT